MSTGYERQPGDATPVQHEGLETLLRRYDALVRDNERRIKELSEGLREIESLRGKRP